MILGQVNSGSGLVRLLSCSPNPMHSCSVVLLRVKYNTWAAKAITFWKKHRMFCVVQKGFPVLGKTCPFAFVSFILLRSGAFLPDCFPSCKQVIKQMTWPLLVHQLQSVISWSENCNINLKIKPNAFITCTTDRMSPCHQNPKH